MRNDARNQNDIDGPVTHGLICDIDLATDRVSRGRQYEITHWPRAPLVQSSASARKNGVNLRSVPIGSQNHGEIIQAAAYRGIGRGNTPKYWTGVSIQGPFWVQAVWKRFSSPQKLQATGRDGPRRDRLSLFLLYRVWSQSGRNLGPC